MESAASGHLAARRVLARLRGERFVPPPGPPPSARSCGTSPARRTRGATTTSRRNVVYALFPPLAERHQQARAQGQAAAARAPRPGLPGLRSRASRRPRTGTWDSTELRPVAPCSASPAAGAAGPQAGARARPRPRRPRRRGGLPPRRARTRTRRVFRDDLLAGDLWLDARKVGAGRLDAARAVMFSSPDGTQLALLARWRFREGMASCGWRHAGSEPRALPRGRASPGRRAACSAGWAKPVGIGERTWQLAGVPGRPAGRPTDSGGGARLRGGRRQAMGRGRGDAGRAGGRARHLRLRFRRRRGAGGARAAAAEGEIGRCSWRAYGLRAATAFAFSPDGKELALLSTSKPAGRGVGQLYRLPRAGGTPQLVGSRVSATGAGAPRAICFALRTTTCAHAPGRSPFRDPARRRASSPPGARLFRLRPARPLPRAGSAEGRLPAGAVGGRPGRPGGRAA